ncbi:MAG: hypothetical protein EBX41_00030 [Chitinophagia bacterium]|nr:hypothetical protein [Chitinophagia bacterium]
MPRSYTGEIVHAGKRLAIAIIEVHKRDGVHFEVNIAGEERCFMKWASIGRYDATDPDCKLPYDLLLTTSDFIEQRCGKK